MINYLKFLLAVCAVSLFGMVAARVESCRSKKVETTVQTKNEKNERTDKALVGLWGGKSTLLNVGEGGAGVDFSCAHGAIEQPLRLDQKGGFDLPGVYVRESFGPQREGEERSQPARYQGSVSGQTMTLTIKLTQTNETIGPMTLTLGRMTRLHKCQ